MKISSDLGNRKISSDLGNRHPVIVDQLVMPAVELLEG
jgi:hypothetical protein